MSQTNPLLQIAETKRASPLTFEHILHAWIGDFGVYQAFLFLLMAVPCALITAGAASWTFTGADVPHSCIALDERMTEHDRKSLQCLRPTNLSLLTSLAENSSSIELALRAGNETCPGDYIWNYNESVVTRSGIDRWEIVCDRQFLQSLVQSSYYYGQFFGSLFFGIIGDRFGRKVGFVSAYFVYFAASACMAFVPRIELFALLRSICGFMHPGVNNLALVVGMEMVGNRFRMLSAAVSSISCAFGGVYLAAAAYFLRDYQHLQLALSAPGVLSLFYWWLFPESTRWLISKNRFEDADRILRRAARWNRQKSALPDGWWNDFEVDREEKTEKSAGIIDIFRSKHYRLRTIICCITFFSVGMTYFGLTMIPAILGGNVFVTFIVASLCEIPGALIGAAVTNLIGRKLTIMIGFGLAGSVLLGSLAVSTEMNGVLVALYVMSQFAVSGTFDQQYVHTPEMYPTVMRNTALGVCSTMSRLGAIFASMVALWLAKNDRVIIMLVFGCGSFLSCFLTLFLPETSGRELTDFADEAEEKTPPAYRDCGGSLCRSAEKHSVDVQNS